MTSDTGNTTRQHAAREGSPSHLVVGDQVGTVLIEQLSAAGCDVALVPSDGGRTVTDVAVYDIDPTDGSEFEAVGEGVRTVVVATDDDATNLLVAQLARTHLDAERVVVRVNDPRTAPTFEDVEARTISAPAVLGSALAGAAVGGDPDAGVGGNLDRADRPGDDVDEEGGWHGQLRRLVDEPSNTN